MRRLVSSLFVALLVSLTLERPAEAGGRRLEKKAAKAAHAADSGDYGSAVQLGLEVLEQDPTNMDAAWAVGCGAAMLVLQGRISEADRESVASGAVTLLTFASQDTANPVRAAMARGLLVDLTGSSFVLQRPEPSCPDAARAAFDEAETAFGKGDMETARGHYERALASCPSNATWIVYLGDTWMQSDTARALEAYERALALDPCHPQAHRFAADVLTQATAPEELLRGYDHALAAVACDPTYDEGWATFEVYLKAGRSGIVPRDAAVTDAEGYKVYADALAATPGDDPLARREAAIREVFKQGPPDTPLWRLLLDASGKDMLEEAILFELLDEELSATFLGQRAERIDKLKAYVTAEHVRR